LKASLISPPLQPSFPYEVEQSTNYYSENDCNPVPNIAESDSSAPVAEKAQQDPH